MQIHSWQPHSARVEVAVEQVAADQLAVEWLITGLEAALLSSPTVQPMQRVPEKELWRDTCFEVFIGPRAERSYLEWNISSNGEWNCYAFNSERQRAHDPGALSVSGFTREVKAMGVRLGCELALPSAWRATDLVGQVTAIVFDPAPSYWAHRHPQERPDFHRRAFWPITRINNQWSSK